MKYMREGNYFDVKTTNKYLVEMTDTVWLKITCYHMCTCMYSSYRCGNVLCKNAFSRTQYDKCVYQERQLCTYCILQQNLIISHDILSCRFCFDSWSILTQFVPTLFLIDTL